ncbi:methyltransferase domain-containing protein [archaeon]|nr:methyltransferase domain-containing protein [archaeon]
MENPMLKMLKSQVQGFTYLLSNPPQLKHLIIRETRYRQRHYSKQRWIEWQKYNSSRISAALRDHAAEALMLPFNVARIQTISGMVSPLGNSLTVLDVGGGDGVIGERLWKMGNSVTTVDLPTVSTHAHRSRCLLAVAGDAEKLPFSSNSFDVVLASEIVEHLWNPHSFFDEAYRVLKADGHLIMSTPAGIEGLRYDSHKHYFTVEILKQLLGARFTVIEVKRLTDVGTPTPTLIILFHKSVLPKT